MDEWVDHARRLVAEGSSSSVYGYGSCRWTEGCVGPDTCVLPKSHRFCVQFPTA